MADPKKTYTLHLSGGETIDVEADSINDLRRGIDSASPWLEIQGKGSKFYHVRNAAVVAIEERDHPGVKVGSFSV